MTLALDSDEETYIELPTLSHLIKCPPIPNTSDQETLVDRACFVRGMQSVAYAMAVDKKLFTYMCVLFESWHDRMRFIAGTGGRFACFSIDSNNQQISEEEIRMLFPKSNVSNVIRIFRDSNQPTIRVRTVEQDPKNNIREQIVLENNSITLSLYDLENYTKYPDLDSIINHDYSYRITTDIKDWKSIIEAIKASYHSHEDVIHNTELIADLLHGYFEVRTNSTMQISRRVGFWLGTYVADNSEDKSHKPWIRCNSDYLLEFVKKGYKDGLVTFHFDDQAKLDEIPDDISPKK
ncbi:MAG: hypothetical protein ACYS67_05585 [Planctomycetota bacterium]|jgi:hypothetical protein